MPVRLPTYTVCYHCHGVGEIPAYTLPDQPGSLTVCFVCSGTGEIETEAVESTVIVDAVSAVDIKCSDVLDKCNDILDKCNDIFEKCQEIFEKLKK